MKGTGSFADGQSDVSAQPGENVVAAEVGNPRGTKKDLLDADRAGRGWEPAPGT
ncbi:hypothetical protein R4P64_30710 [Rhodococcus sp. IEGM 1366]|uniref:hypothetical protein n=1 Tax=Rhodococcus sp. IEGM 1366 TaxID=3082223 RepID=UPI002953E60F|nr:hypothetical protein [Rhodococcus sp. IEGM 1366]MDV8070900.1 hypothetical protein [Rhodococcus sp. IEGM 1366]